MEYPLYRELASLIDARSRVTDNRANEGVIEYLVKNCMPSGSGIDSGTKIDLDKSSANKLVFTTAFHHMDDSGYYDGWTEHTVTVTPSLIHGFELKISGRDKNEIKDYLYGQFYDALTADITFERQAAYFEIDCEPIFMNGDLVSWRAKVNGVTQTTVQTLEQAHTICIDAAKSGLANRRY